MSATAVHDQVRVAPQRRDDVHGEKPTQVAVTVILGAIAVLTFTFRFGNIWALGLRLGVPGWIAPLVGPAVDLSVIGLLIAVRHLSMRGVGDRQLRSARCLLVFSGTLTLTLNVAEPLAEGAHGRALFDAVGPLLLIGWAEVGPRLLRLLHATGNRPDDTVPPDSSAAASSTVVLPSGDERDVPGSESVENEWLERARVFDQRHRRRYGRPVSADTLRGELSVGSARARRLVRAVRAEATGGSV